jgi:hypothetical protein
MSDEWNTDEIIMDLKSNLNKKILKLEEKDNLFSKTLLEYANVQFEFSKLLKDYNNLLNDYNINGNTHCEIEGYKELEIHCILIFFVSNVCPTLSIDEMLFREARNAPSDREVQSLRGILPVSYGGFEGAIAVEFDFLDFN